MPSSTTDAPALPILVVDDDSALIRTLADILKLHGYAPATAETGRAGLQLARERVPVLAVVDLRLPDMDGIELVSRLHELSGDTAVVVLTGNASIDSAIAALREHSIDYLIKPVQVDQLMRVVSVAKERWQRHRADADRIVAEQALRESEERYRTRALQQAAVARLGQRALAADDVTALLGDATQLVAQTLELKYCTVLELRPNGNDLTLRAGTGWASATLGEAVSASDDTQSGYTLRHDEPVIVGDLALDQRFRESTLLRANEVRSGVTVVIPGPLHPYGVLAAHDVRVRDFTQDDVHFMQAIAHIVGTAIERHRTEIALGQAQRLEAVGRLAGGVAHDFNNMLTAITGYGEMVKASLRDDDPMAGDVTEILKAAQRAAGLTRQLLAFSRQQVLQPRIVEVNRVVADMENMLRRLIGEHITFATSLDPKLGTVKADPGQLEQVILNLCINARDAMPSGGALTIETANIDLERPRSSRLGADIGSVPHVMLAVTDTGTGMDADTRARIFDPFFTTKSPESGTGLGLATVYGIVKQSGGDVWVYSEVGRGSTFKIFLPRIDATAPAEHAAERRQESARGSETVLLAEDDDAVRRLTQRVLQREGYTVLLARNGEDALRVSRENAGAIHLLVSDVVMPAMNGQVLADRLRAQRPALRTLFLSGYTDSTVLREGLVDDDAHFIQKPFTSDALVRKVREILDA